MQAWLNLRNGGSIVSASYESQVFNSSAIEKVGQMWSNVLGYLNQVLAGALIPIFGERVTYLIGQTIPLLANTIIILLIIFGLLLSLKKCGLMDIYFIIYALNSLYIHALIGKSTNVISATTKPNSNPNSNPNKYIIIFFGNIHL